MCEGRRPADACRPAAVELRRREAAANAQLAEARARLAEALAKLERARARAAELRRRFEETYVKRRRLVEEARGRFHEIRALLYDGRHERSPPILSPSPTPPLPRLRRGKWRLDGRCQLRQGDFGKDALFGFGLTTYSLLGLGVLGGPLSLPWGLYVLICQRTPEKPCLNDVSDVGTWRRVALIVSVFLVLTLIPLWDELAEDVGVGPVTSF